jgi:hypothetical protein
MNDDKYRRGKIWGYISGLAAFLLLPAGRHFKMDNPHEIPYFYLQIRTIVN